MGSNIILTASIIVFITSIYLYYKVNKNHILNKEQ